ncbi:MAG: CPBP family intramembrane glutamic endopeptidase [Balneolaceae bacterium]
MSSLTQPINSYFYQSRGILYSYLFALPLLVLYEILIRISQPDQEYIVRISVDIWFSLLFTLFGLDAFSFTFLIAAIAGAIIVYNKRSQLRDLKIRYFGWMLLECLIYAIVLAMVINILIGWTFNLSVAGTLNELSKLQLFALSLGAGLYEELFFRVILVSVLFYIFNKIFQGKNSSYFLAVIIAALIFSGVHYVGEFGDIWSLRSFIFRFMFGLGLNLIYVKRGFGCAAWTHALYDIIVVLGR